MENVEITKKIIFVGGIHGVGKTTICRKISEVLSLKHYSASELISYIKSENISRDKKVSNVKENQDILLESVDKYLDKEENYLLDGHFCLLNADGDITRVPYNTFNSLGIKAIIILVDEESQILKRLNNRDEKHYLLSIIKELQEREINYAHEVAKRIGVMCKIINASSDFDEMLLFVDTILNHKSSDI